MQSQEYWNKIGSTKVFEDPLYLDKLARFLTPDSNVIEYGCGYGRMMKMLRSGGYKNLTGFDFAERMIARGKQENPELDLRLLEKSGVIPCSDVSVDAVMMSTVLCCMVDSGERARLVDEILRVLKPGGIVYLTDFLYCDHPMYEEKYLQGMKEFGKRGIYKTTENLVVQHYSSQEIMELLTKFDIQWFEQFDFKTMNQNPARTFHSISRKP